MLYMLLINVGEADFARMPDALFGFIEIRPVMELYLQLF